MKLPDFLVVGAAKCGTTSVFHYFCQHPDIFIPRRKEGRFFSQMPGNFTGPGAAYQNDIIRTFEDYCELYKDADENMIAGDVSNDYLYFHENSIPAVQKYLGPDVKIIIVLRNPADRAYSHYMHHVKNGHESVSFRQALDDEEKRQAENWSWTFFYKKAGLYSSQVKPFLEAFKHTKVYLFEECWFDQKQEFLKECFDFIGLRIPDELQDYKSNISGQPKSKIIQGVINCLGPFRRAVSPTLEKVIGKKKVLQLQNYIKKKNLRKVPVEKQIRDQLLEYFEPDIRELSKILNKNLDLWLK